MHQLKPYFLFPLYVGSGTVLIRSQKCRFGEFSDSIPLNTEKNEEKKSSSYYFIINIQVRNIHFFPLVLLLIFCKLLVLILTFSPSFSHYYFFSAVLLAHMEAKRNLSPANNQNQEEKTINSKQTE